MLPNSPSGTSRHDDIYMLDATTGWTARGRAGIHKTTDGGNTWTQVKSSTNSYPGTNLVAHFRAISFLTATHGFAGNLGPGSYDGNVTDTNLLYETFDGGTTWTNHPGFAEAGMMGICAFHVLDSQTIYGGGRVRGSAHFIKSTDGGTNWTILNLNTNGLGVMGGIMDVYFKDKTNGFLVGMSTNSFATSCGLTYYGRIARTTDGGTNWTPVATTGIPCCYFWKMSWPSPDVGYVSLQQNVTSNTNLNNTLIYYKTTDGGATWNSNGVPYTNISATIASSSDGYYWQGVGFISTNEGWAGGDGSSSPYSDNFLHTTNGGATWTTEGYNNSASINRIRVLSPTLAYASGQKLHVFRIALGITAQPQSQTTNIGSTATFSVTAQGTDPLGYQWRFNGTNISGATTNPFSISNAQSNNAGSYDVVVSDYSGSITSTVAVLSLTGIAPSISGQPQNVTTNEGQNATFTVTASGTAPLGYQWRFNTADIAGATNSGYTRSNAQFADAGSYTVVVTNSVGSVTSAVATLTVLSNPPSITAQPQNQSVSLGSNATFTVTASGTAPLNYQWRFNGANLSGATGTSYTRTNAQLADVGSYSVVVTNVVGSVTSAVATLTFALVEDFDGYGSPSIVTNAGTTNGYKIFFGADSGAEDFKVIFGFDYSTVTFPTNIPSAPHSTGGTTKGLYLTVNKDATAAAAGVNLYPVGQSVSGNFALKFDLWINWTTLGISTEHSLFGINHSGNVTNRVGQTTSDGLFFAVAGDGNVAAGNTSVRDFSCFRGSNGIPFLMLTNNTTFGPTPPLGPQFDNLDPGFVSLFPSNTIAGFTNVNGSAGLRWISGEVRQEFNLITCLLNGTAIAQYTNTFAYTNGTVMIGYNDAFGSTIGTANNFAIFDNIRVEAISISPVQLLSPQIVGANFTFSFATEPYKSYTVQRATDLTAQNWANYTNVVGNGNTTNILVPLLTVTNTVTQQYIRVSRP